VINWVSLVLFCRYLKESDFSIFTDIYITPGPLVKFTEYFLSYIFLRMTPSIRCVTSSKKPTFEQMPMYNIVLLQSLGGVRKMI